VNICTRTFLVLSDINPEWWRYSGSLKLWCGSLHTRNVGKLKLLSRCSLFYNGYPWYLFTHLFFRKVIGYLPSCMRMEVMLSMLCVSRIMCFLCQRNWPSAKEVACAFHTSQLTGPWLSSKSTLNFCYRLCQCWMCTFLSSVWCDS